MSTTEPPDLAAAHDALHAGDFDAAAAAFRAALREADDPRAHHGLAYLSYLDDDFDAARREWEVAYRGFRAAGDLRSAARAAIHLAGVHFDGFMNESAAAGWLGRAERLLDRAGRCVERGYLALALVACDVRNANVLEQSAAVALELASEFADADLEALALSAAGLAQINQGRIAAGFGQLGEAMAAVSAGEVSPLYTGKIFCALLTACERTGDLRRAQDWSRTCSAMLDASAPGKLPILHTHCRVAYGIVLCDTGQWNEGETELLHALGPSATKAQIVRAEGVAALAGLRLVQGRIEEAAELLAPYADRFEVCEQMATLHLHRGEHDLAVAVVVRALHELVGDRLRAGRLLALLVDAELGRGNAGGAERALERLAAAAQASESAVLDAAAKLAEGRLEMHHGRPGVAVAAPADGVRLLGDEQRPILAGRIRVELAGALAATGDAAAAVAEARAALAMFERLGAARDADKVAAVLRGLGSRERLASLGREAAVASLTTRENEVFALLGEGLSNAEIASRLFITPKTAEHHVGRVLSKLGVRGRAEAAALFAARAAS